MNRIEHTFCEAEGWLPVLCDLPAGIVPIGSSEQYLDKYLERNNIIILVYAVWSTPDVRWAKNAIDTLRLAGWRETLCLAPFEHEHTLNAWLDRVGAKSEGLYRVDRCATGDKCVVTFMPIGESHPVVVRVTKGFVSAIVGKASYDLVQLASFVSNQ